MNFEIPYRIKLVGFAGDGIISAADFLFQTINNLGYYTSVYNNLPSSIKNGNTSCLISIATNKIICPIGETDVTICLRTIDLKDDLKDIKNNCIIFTGDVSAEIKYFLKSVKLKNIRHFLFSSLSLVNSINSFNALGILSYMFGFETSYVMGLISNFFNDRTFSDKSKNDFTIGYTWAEKSNIVITKLSKQPVIDAHTTIDGNGAISQGAIDAECKFFASYPITPATTIGDTLSKLLPLNKGVAYQAEDEIAAVAAVTGASFSGVKSMTATSGPGLSLMQEFIGYLSMVELPAVIVNVMRAGPSTGMPTHHGQDDLLSSIFGGHGEDQRIIIAPASIEDCYNVVIDAFNCSEQYACPVIILSDYSFAFTKIAISLKSLSLKNIVKRKVSDPSISPCDYKRFSDDNIIFPFLPAPGISKCTYHITGLEHDQNSFPSESMDIRENQIKRRFEKVNSVNQDYSHLIEWDLEEHDIYKADASIIAWGFTVMCAKDAIVNLRNKKYRIAALYPRLLFPVCIKELQKLYTYSQLVIIPESNFTGQYASLVKMNTTIQPISIYNISGQPYTPEYLTSKIENIILQKK